MRRSEPIREILPRTPKPGVELVYKRFSRLPQGGIICTVSYLESKKPAPAPPPLRKLTFWERIAAAFSRFRGALAAGLRQPAVRITPPPTRSKP